jgi:Flp pilus assembly protein TadB
MKWTLFLAAAILSWWLLLSIGAPVFAIAAGTGLAAFLTWRNISKRAS